MQERNPAAQATLICKRPYDSFEAGEAGRPVTVARIHYPNTETQRAKKKIGTETKPELWKMTTLPSSVKKVCVTLVS